MRVGLDLIQRHIAPKRKIVLVARTVKPAHGPQRLPTIKPDGTKRICAA